MRGDVSVIRQIGNHSPPAHCKLHLTLVIAKVNVLSLQLCKNMRCGNVTCGSNFNDRKVTYVLHEGKLLAVSRNSFRFSVKSYLGISLPDRRRPPGMSQSQGLWISGNTLYLGKISQSNIFDILSKDTRTNSLLTLRNWLKTYAMLADSKCSSLCSWSSYLYWLPWDQTSPLLLFSHQSLCLHNRMDQPFQLPLEKFLSKVWESLWHLLGSWSTGDDPL